MKVAIIIPTFNRRNLLKNILNQLREQTIIADTIIVVNDNSTDGTNEMLINNYKEIICLQGNGDLWWTGSINVGLRYVLKNFPNINGVVLLNDDVIIDSDWLYNLLEVAKNNKDSLVGCVAVDYENTDKILYAGKYVNTWLGYLKFPYRGEKLSNYEANKIVSSFDLIGRGTFIPIVVFREIGLYDEIHFKHRGDTELPLRARIEKGYDLIVSFKPVVKIMPNNTASIDIKSKLSLKEVITRMTDFRASTYWKYKFYYVKIYSKSTFQHWFVFSVMILKIFVGGIARMMIPRK